MGPLRRVLMRILSVMRTRGVTLVALAAGSAPSFLLPVVVVLVAPLDESAAFLLATSLSMITFSAIGAPYETTMLVRFGGRYGGGAPTGRAAFGQLMLHAASRLGPVLIAFFFVCLVGTVALSDEIDATTLVTTGACIILQPVIQSASTPLTAHLYATRHFPAVYFSSFFRGGPSIIVALVFPQPVAIAVSYTLGELVRAAYLFWRVEESLPPAARSNHLDISAPRWRELAPQSVASLSGQALPLVIQGALAASGAPAVAAGTIALRLWGAAFQVGSSTIAMPEVVTLTHLVTGARPEGTHRRVLKRGIVVLLASTLLATGLCGLIALALFQQALDIPPDISAGLMWSLVVMVAIPPAMVNFWAGRGLVAIGKGWSLPVAVGAGFTLGLIACLLCMPMVGGLGAMIAQVVNFAAMGALSSWLLLKATKD